MTTFTPKRASQPRGFAFKCYHCGQKAHTTTTKEMSDKVQHRYMLCSNTKCRAVFMLEIAVVRDIHAPMPPIEQVVAEHNANNI